jgi:hypothetical protein
VEIAISVIIVSPASSKITTEIEIKLMHQCILAANITISLCIVKQLPASMVILVLASTKINCRIQSSEIALEIKV